MKYKMGKVNKIIIGVVLLALVFGWISVARAGGNVTSQIEITDLGTDEMHDGKGYVDFQNVVYNIFLTEDEEYNVSGVLRVYNDETVIVSELITLEVISFHGFAVNRPDTREFDIYMTEGIHELWAVFESTDTSEAKYIYEVVVEDEKEEEEKVEEVEDWLECP
jgi:hypothetical protein